MVDNITNKISRNASRGYRKDPQEPLLSTIKTQNSSSTTSRGSSRFFNDLADAENAGDNSEVIKTLGNSSSRKSNRYLKLFDKNKDGNVSDDEAIDFILQNRNQNQKTLRALISYNDNAKDFNKITQAFDQATANGIFDNDELVSALLALKTKDFSDIKFDNAVKILKRNSQFDEIKTIVDLIDKNSNGAISDMEVLDTVLASRQGLVDLNNQNVRKVLGTNVNFEKIVNLLQNVSGNFNGEITDQDVFNVLMGIRSGNISDDQALMSLFLSKNPNRDKIANSIDVLDKDSNGNVSNTEFTSFILNYRNGNINQEQNLIVKNILETNNNFQNLLNVINAIDNDKSGLVSDEEVINFSLAVKAGTINLNNELTEVVLSHNNNLQSIKNLLIKVDNNNNGEISSNEVFSTISSLRKGEFSETDAVLVNKIISTNSNKEKILNAIDFVDSSKDGIIDEDELISAEISYRKGLATNIDREIFDLVIQSNSKSQKILDSLNIFDPDKNGSVSQADFINKILDERKGLITFPDSLIFNKIKQIIDKDHNAISSLEVFDSNNDGVIDDKSFTQGVLASRAKLINPNTEFINLMASKNTNSQIILDAINILDADKSGVVSAAEFSNNFTASVSVNGVVDFNRMSIISNLLDVIYPDAVKLDKFRDDIDANNDNVLSDSELINGLLNLRNGSIQNPGLDIVRVVIAANQNYQNITDVIDKIDLDKNGVISDSDTLAGLLAVRHGKFSNEQLPFAQAVLMKNSKYEELQNVLNLFDKDLNGEISNLELMDASFKIRRGELAAGIDAQIIETLKNLNPNRKKIDDLINAFDLDGSGKVDNNELVRGLLAINSGALARPDNELLINLPNFTGEDFGDSILRAETLIKQIDQNKNGQVGDNEIASVILANKANGILTGFDEGFINAVFATNPKSAEIKNIINSIDTDNDGFFSDNELVDSILAYRKGDLRASSNELFDMILSNHSEYSRFKTLISQIDTDANGVVSDQNLVESLFQNNSNSHDARSKEILNLILNKNSSRASLEASYKLLETASSGNMMRMKNTLLEMKFGEATNPAFQNLIEPASGIINAWDSEVKSEYSKQVGNLITAITSHAQNKDLDALGISNLQAFISSLDTIKTDLVGGKKSSFNDLQDLIDGYSARIQATPSKTPGLISGIFYADFKANLRTVEKFLTTGTMDSYSSQFQEIANLAQQFDRNSDGHFSDQEVMNGLLDVSFNKITVSNKQYLDLIFNSNVQYQAIKGFITNSDIDNNGIISKSELLSLYNSVSQSNNAANKDLLRLMGRYEDFAPAFRTIEAFNMFGNGEYTDGVIFQGILQMRKNTNLSYDPETLNSILSQNSDSTGIQKLINLIDPDGNGYYDNNKVVDYAVAVWSNQIPSNNLAYDFNGDGVVNSSDGSTLFSLHMNVNNLSNFVISR